MLFAFAWPVLVAIGLIFSYHHIVPPDANLTYLPNGIALMPYEEYGPRDVDVYYGLLIGVFFALGIFLPLLLWYRSKQRGI
jgi:hypothetical protein